MCITVYSGVGLGVESGRVYVHGWCVCECIAGPRGVMLAACVTAARAGLAKNQPAVFLFKRLLCVVLFLTDVQLSL